MASDHYSEFIEEAFVKPIRSVLIVDDDYPTFEEMLDAQLTRDGGGEPARTKAWYENPTRIKNVIESFRTPNRPLLVDIHDGTNVGIGDDVKVAAHLHQSDLLVLDYQLDKAKPGDGTRAIKIIRSLTVNDHFNLVVVHTSEKLDDVFQSILIALMSPCDDALTDEENEQIVNLLEDAELASEGLTERLFASVGLDHYLHSRAQAATFLRTMLKGQHPYEAFRAICEEAGWAVDVRRLLLRYVLARIEKPFLANFSDGPQTALAWSSGAVKWIKTDTVFVAFSNKGDDDDLLSDLQNALEAWKPQPSRLFLAKLRAEMDEYGVTAQSSALGNKHALAHWYDRLLKAAGPERRWLIAETVSRHSDQLLSGILPRVEAFATRLVDQESSAGNSTDLCKGHFAVDLGNDAARIKAEREHNAFVCSKPPEGWHLTTGHVFTMNGHFWVCLSPACDMVPSQLSAARKAAFGDRLPFMAVRLQPVSDNKVPSDVQSNRFLFLPLNGEVKAFCFNDPSGESSAPTWHTLYAEKKGMLGSGFTFIALSTEMGKTRLITHRHSAVIVCQLRYEYALNLMQRLGSSLTRIGLDFVPVAVKT
ncbi:response regulator receiver domain [Sphingobium sp. Sx8-8]|uniref:response regulator receiver domain n=1 Tax=Sphingobium sp. Sx8-8 TaxID=2933617 RepID=UPI001F56BB60|nr:response regulator receiver domain [Sphingobium sp. Sx8-8]